MTAGLLKTLAGGTALALVLAMGGPALAQDALDLSQALQPGPGSQDVTSVAKPKTGPFKIGFSNISVVNTWRVQMAEEAKYEASQHKEISEFLMTDAGGSSSKQVADIEDLLARNVDALVIAPGSTTSLNPVIERAAKQGVPVFVFNSDVTTNAVTSRLVSDERYFGQAGAEYLVEQMGHKGSIVGLRGIAGMSIDDDRWNAAMDVFKKYPDIKVIDSAFGEWAYDKGKQICESLVLGHPQIDGIWSSGGAMTQACAETLNDNGRKLVPMTGEGNNGFLRVWQEMKLKSIAPIDPTWLSAQAVVASLRYLEGKPLKNAYLSKPKPITGDDLASFYKADLNDSYWVGSILPDATLKTMYAK